MAEVDRRVELLSVVARLAAYSEYVNNQFKSYAADVDAFFANYRNHPVVEYASKLRSERGVSYDAVMSMAVHLDPPPKLTQRVTFTEKAPDPRWGKEAAERFADLLRRFYSDANRERFFQAHEAMYKTAAARFQLVLNKVDFDWYRRFYGELPVGTFNLYVGLLNGGGNYGPKVVHTDGTEDLYAIIGTSQTDSAGLPVYGEEVLSLIIHEYNHSFINHLLFENDQQLNAAGEKVSTPSPIR